MAAGFKMAALFPQNLNIFGYNSNTIAWISMKLYMAMPYYTTMSTLKQKSNMAAGFKMAALFPQNLNIFGCNSNTIAWISMKFYVAMP